MFPQKIHIGILALDLNRIQAITNYLPKIMLYEFRGLALRIARSLIIDLGIHAKIESLPSQMVLPQTSTSVPIFQKTSLQSRF